MDCLYTSSYGRLGRDCSQKKGEGGRIERRVAGLGNEPELQSKRRAKSGTVQVRTPLGPAKS